MNEYFFFSILIFFTLMISALISVKYQKYFYHFNRSSNFFGVFLTFSITLTISYFIFIISDIMKLTKIETSENFHSTKQTNPERNVHNNEIVLLFISIINIFFYIIIPFIFFYFVEERNTQREENSEIPTTHDQNDKENLLENLRNCDDSNINPSFYQIESSPWNISLAKNYFYYLLAYSCLNIAYLIGFKINNSDSAKNLIRYSIMPEELRIFSNLNSDFEVIAFANLGLLITTGKFLLLIYLPYGLGAALAGVIEKLRNKSIEKKEYNRLDKNFTKNYETIKSITSTKMMTGRPLTKRERKTLKTCKEQDAVLQHKQEILEEKFSTLQKIIQIIILPVKYVYIVLSIIISVCFLISKGYIVYNELGNSICGSQCGFIVNTSRTKFSLQSIMLYLVNHEKIHYDSVVYKALIITIFLSLFLYFLSSVIFALYTIGIVNPIPFGRSYSFLEITQESNLKLILYSICSLTSLILLLEIFQLVPDLSYFYDSYDTCDIFNIGSTQCSISLLGLIVIKLYVNFIVFKYCDLFFSVLMMCLITLLIIFLPLRKLFRTKEDDEKIPLNIC